MRDNPPDKSEHPAVTARPSETSCCAPSFGASANIVNATPPARLKQDIPARFVRLSARRAIVGTARPLLPIDGEGLLREVRVGAVAVDPFAVTNEWFAAFVSATGYVTDAERVGWSFVFHSFAPAGAGPAKPAPGTPWWRAIDGARWDQPKGPGSTLEGIERHPVVQVSLNDARAFAAWAGGRLPSEAEWEYAARGGLGDVPYPWGEQAPTDGDFLPCNIWQGTFPDVDTGADGWTGTCPVDAFAPNGYGLYNMCGNVWEWCDQPMRIRSSRRELRARDDEFVAQGMMLMKGGSHLCHRSYCHRYRIAARSGSTSDSATGHIGFRLVFDLK
jgi:formylglycine-generating enzyme